MNYVAHNHEVYQTIEASSIAKWLPMLLTATLIFTLASFIILAYRGTNKTTTKNDIDLPEQ